MRNAFVMVVMCCSRTIDTAGV